MYITYKAKPPISQLAKPTTGDPIYDLGQAAAILNCSEQTLAEKFKSGEIRARKKMGKWLTTHSNLLAYLNS